MTNANGTHSGTSNPAGHPAPPADPLAGESGIGRGVWLGLIVIAAAVILLAARMLVVRRGEELAMLRARGGSLGQVIALMLRGSLVAVVPAAVAGTAIAVAVIPGDAAASGLGWLLAGITVAVALAGPAPALGQHTDEILGEFGFGAGEISGLRANRIIN